MTLEIPTGYAHIGMQFRHNLDPEPWWVTWGVDVSDFGTTDLAEIGAGNINAFWPTFVDQFSTAVTLLGCQVRLGDDSASPPVHFQADGRNGSNTDAKLPQNCALLVKKQTGLGGRQHRGRMFMPGVLSEGEVDAVGQISSASMTSLTGDVVNFLSALESGVGEGPMPMVVLHNQTGTDTPLPTPVTSLVVDPRISTQRRRLR